MKTIKSILILTTLITTAVFANTDIKPENKAFCGKVMNECINSELHGKAPEITSNITGNPVFTCLNFKQFNYVMCEVLKDGSVIEIKEPTDEGR